MKRTTKFFTICALIIFTLILTTLVAHAAKPPIDESFRPSNIPFNLDYTGTATSNTVVILNLIASAILYFAAPVAIIVIAYSGFQMIIGNGEPEKIEEGKKTLIWSVVALFVMILSYSIIRIVLDITIKAGDAVT